MFSFFAKVTANTSMPSIAPPYRIVRPLPKPEINPPNSAHKNRSLPAMGETVRTSMGSTYVISSVRGVHTRRKQGISVRLMQYACWWSVPPIPPERMFNHAATHLSALNRLQPRGGSFLWLIRFILIQGTIAPVIPQQMLYVSVKCNHPFI